MKYFLRYLLLAAAITVLALFQALHIPDQYTEVKAFRGATLEGAVFDPLIARSLNENYGVSVTMDGTRVRLYPSDIYMNVRLQPMGSLAMIRDIFSCNAHMYGGTEIWVKRGMDSVLMHPGTLEGEINGQTVALSEAPLILNGNIFLPIKDIAAIFGFSCTINSEGANRQIALSSEAATPLSLPAAFDLRDEGRVAPTMNQGTESTCWAHASTGAMESALRPEDNAFFDVEDMIAKKGYSFKGKTGGDYSQALAYLLSWKGPVTLGTSEPVKDYHLSEVRFFTADDIDAIKLAIYKNGGVTSSIYSDTASTGTMVSSPYYNALKNAYCYTGTEEPNHDIVIIGWDDERPASDFGGKARGKGAFICQNSWGEDFGDNGVFYVSYYDSNIGSQAVSYSRIMSSEGYDIIHQSDLCGWTGQIGYSGENVFAANIFTAGVDEDVSACGFYALGKDTIYEVYIVEDFQGVEDLSKRKPVASGRLENKGYYTISFDSPVFVSAGERFAVMLSITTPGVAQPMAVEYTSERMEGEADISDGEGYISVNGLDWTSVEEKSHGNLCLKAYSNIKERSEGSED